MAENVVTKQAGDVLHVTLNRPDRLDSNVRGMHGALRDALAAAGDPTVRAVLLSGTKRGFCAGQDLADVVPGQGALE